MADEIQHAISPVGEVVQVRLKVVPGASRTRLVGMLGDRLKVQVADAPEGGKANKAVCRLLADALGVARQQVAITSGRTRPEKTAAVTGMSPAAVVDRLVQAVGS